MSSSKRLYRLQQRARALLDAPCVDARASYARRMREFEWLYEGWLERDELNGLALRLCSDGLGALRREAR